MGTSQSSSGSPSGVPMVPPWVPDIPLPGPTLGGAATGEGGPPEGAPNDGSPPSLGMEPRQPVPIAPARRFLGANRNIGEYSRSGDRATMHRGLGQYVKKGYGGSATATRRMGGTAQTAQALYSALSGGQANPYAVPGSPLDPALTTGRSADEVMDAVVEAVRPVDGTQDAEASRTSIKDALADVLNQFPNADLLNLQQEQRELAVERFVAADVFRRIDLDIGRTIREKAPNAAIGLGRLKEVREYVRETVSASFRNLREAGQSLVAGRVTQIVQSAIRETFQVFEGYVE
ncbi:MAG: Qat anti-phage system associated protein QatB [Bacteroidales bacterium]